MHRLLKRQVKKVLGENYLEDEKIRSFLDLVSEYYDEKDGELRLFENALDLSSLELTELNLQLRKMAFYDDLTGLLNRKIFEEELNLTLKHIGRNKHNIALLFLDLDNFKNINDTLGHDIGDKLLVKVSKILNDCIRNCDTLGRWGGDEFVLLLDELSHVEDCSVIVENIQSAFEKKLHIEEHKLSISFSIGINIYEPGQTALDMIKYADMAMYSAKESGKNNYAFYSSTIGERVMSYMKVSHELTKAVEKREFVVYYQPQIDISSGKIIGAEALVRWNHPTKGLVYPDEFICIAEEKGHIVELGHQVLKQACMDMKYWIDSGYEMKSIAVNLSVKEIRQEKFIQTIIDILQDTGIDSSYLEFEITETMIMKNYEKTAEVLEKLRSLGIGLSIDDFGTGYSSLAYLKRLPIEKIKIDKSFIDDISNDENDIEITKAIIVMSHSLGLKVLAEGVEDGHQLEILKELSCDKYQGYHCSKPVPADEFERLLKNNAL